MSQSDDTSEIAPQSDQHSKIQFTSVEKPERTPTIEPTPPTATSHSEKQNAPHDGDTKAKPVDINEHLFTPEEIAKRYKVDINIENPAQSRGLSTAEAEKRLAEHGPNVLTPPKKIHPIIKYLKCLSTLFNILLIVAAIFQYILLAIDYEANKPNIYLGAILIGVAFLNAFIEFYQLQKSAAILESFLNMIPQRCISQRDGKLTPIQGANLVCGDVVLIKIGDKVPADVMLFGATDMKVDNSSLTGESEPQDRSITNSHENPLEATNICFNGTVVVAGEGYGIVIRTGDHTVLGQIAGLTAGEKKNESPLSREIDDFVKIIATVAIITAIIFFGAGMKVYHNQISPTLNFAMSVLVAWVPQGLPATVMVLLTIAAKRMAAQNVLVKDLQGVETLGAITLLATDKTGTLTRNRMTVAYVWTALKLHSTFRNLSDPNSPFDANAPGVQEIILNSTLCSRAKFDRTDVPFSEREILGDATETGLVRFAGQNLPDFDKVVADYRKVFEIPFSSEVKWALTINQKPHENGDLTLYMKGAPERVLRFCSTILTENGVIPLTDEHKQQYSDTYEFMASKGHRVLAFAQLSLPRSQYPADYQFKKEEKNFPTENYCFVGLASLEDPPKHGVREAIGHCRSAGIRVIMVTGDHPLTAEAIARKINLMLSETKEMVAKRRGIPVEQVREEEYSAIVIHGEQIDSLSDFDWDNIFSKGEIIFARTSPRHKLEIVKRAQAMGHIVGVTGDGVNDSPALKKADLGIAMNQSGSDVSKEAAAMILLDDNFASTVKGIEEGRLIFMNLKKSIQYTISHLTPEIAVVLLYVVVPLPLPLSAILILVIDLGYELFAALSFAWDKPESTTGLMKLPPRRPVTAKTTERIRSYALMRTPTITDPETGLPKQISRMDRFILRLKKLTSKEWWKQKLDRGEGEILVDGNVLSWAYLEIGIIESIGAIISYLVVLNHNGITPSDARDMQNQGVYFVDGSPDYVTSSGKTLSASQQIEALRQGQSIVYLAIMIQQMFNLFAVKARFKLPFGKFMFSNPRNFAGVAGGAALAMAIVYIPPVNVAFQTSYKLSPFFWLIPLGMGCVILVYTSIRLLILRRSRPTIWNDDISGLDLIPTIYSTNKAI
ncbi:337_t:CDS:2 [Paraglomus brasilianum]|uniref:337_t:CDS:1 n=1 Tax=Paraglomus brasilianum TaxID=144538 RepID=A0A9N9GUN3_9GLOM|nr:337_t:CDS:2 [Paraglomus brasilianum]